MKRAQMRRACTPDELLLGDYVRDRIADELKRIIPRTQRKKITMVRLRVRSFTAGMRVLPDFLVIGTERGGTSSLYKYLGRHPEIAPSLRKETEYFNRFFYRGEHWYRAHFPLQQRRNVVRALGGKLLTFESTPTYLLDSRVPPRVESALPKIKLIVLLRNPIARAISGWRHMRELGFEHLTFEDAICQEPTRIWGEMQRMIADPNYFSRPFFRFSYLERGKYADQLQEWFRHFDRERFLILESEDFFRNPASSYGQILDFLGVRSWRPAAFKVYSSATSQNPINAHADLSAEAYRDVARFFAPHNERLTELLGRSFSWSEPPL